MSKNSNWAHTWWPPIGDTMEAKPTITEFLLARIAEDERVARAATGRSWHGQACEVRTAPRDSQGASEPYWDKVAELGSGNHFANATHMARHDPARVLAECAAKRAIIKQHHDEDLAALANEAIRKTRLLLRMTKSEYIERFDSGPSSPLSMSNNPPIARTLRTLAAVYSDHPDYQSVWSMS